MARRVLAVSGSNFDVVALATAVEEIRESIRAVVAGLMDDGFSEEQARAITTGIMARMGKGSSDEQDEG